MNILNDIKTLGSIDCKNNNYFTNFYWSILIIKYDYPQNVLNHNYSIYISVISLVIWNVSEEYKPDNLLK